MRSITGEPVDRTPQRHDDHCQQDAGARDRHPNRREGGHSGEAGTRLDRNLDDVERVAAEEEPQLRL
jgi:hypothetical protein